jgi:hypothetical protein
MSARSAERNSPNGRANALSAELGVRFLSRKLRTIKAAEA